MITNAMQHACDVLDYLDQIQDPSVFRFCAIPQTMAIATLAECYNNPDVFTNETKYFFWKNEVKIRKTLALKMILNSNSMTEVLQYFYDYAIRIEEDISINDPNAKIMQRYINALLTKIVNHPKFV